MRILYDEVILSLSNWNKMSYTIYQSNKNNKIRGKNRGKSQSTCLYNIPYLSPISDCCYVGKADLWSQLMTSLWSWKKIFWNPLRIFLTFFFLMIHSSRGLLILAICKKMIYSTDHGAIFHTGKKKRNGRILQLTVTALFSHHKLFNLFRVFALYSKFEKWRTCAPTI